MKPTNDELRAAANHQPCIEFDNSTASCRGRDDAEVDIWCEPCLAFELAERLKLAEDEIENLRDHL